MGKNQMYNTTNAVPAAADGYSENHGSRICQSIRTAVSTLHTWSSRHRQRQALRKVDQRILDDIGIAFEDALRETRKPFWQP